MATFSIALDPNQADTAARFRGALSGLTFPTGGASSRSGFFSNDGWSIASMTFTLQAYRGMVFNNANGSAQGGYFIVSDSASTVIHDAGGAQDRHDLVQVRVYDTIYDSSGQQLVQLEIKKGAEGGSLPAADTLAIPIADVLVPAGRTSGNGGLTAANVTDKRPARLATAGGLQPVVSAADRDSLSTNSFYYGQAVYRLDTNKIEALDTTGTWQIINPDPVPPVVVQLATRTGSTVSLPGGTWTRIDMDSGDWTGPYVCTIDGWYQIYAVMAISWNAQGHIGVKLDYDSTGNNELNGSETQTPAIQEGGGPSTSVTLTTVHLEAGDEVYLFGVQSDSVAHSTANTEGAYPRMSVLRYPGA